MNITIENSGVSLSEKEVEAFEAEIGTRLPEEYRTFLLPIAMDSGGNLICLGITGERREQILFWDHERETTGHHVSPVTQTLRRSAEYARMQKSQRLLDLLEELGFSSPGVASGGR